MVSACSHIVSSEKCDKRGATFLQCCTGNTRIHQSRGPLKGRHRGPCKVATARYTALPSQPAQQQLAPGHLFSTMSLLGKIAGKAQSLMYFKTERFVVVKDIYVVRRLRATPVLSCCVLLPQTLIRQQCRACFWQQCKPQSSFTSYMTSCERVRIWKKRYARLVLLHWLSAGTDVTRLPAADPVWHRRSRLG
jgi:hypothetical protein